MYPVAVEKLIEALKRLPGVGYKTAERYALFLCHYKPKDGAMVYSVLAEALQQTMACSLCFNLSDQPQCRICIDTTRDASTILVVSGTPDVEAYERGNSFHGVYHVLRGLIQPVEGIGPEQLTIRALLSRIQKGATKELILGFDPTIEGEVTAQYLTKLFEQFPITVSRIARGLPSGASVEYADDVTLSNALRERKQLSLKKVK